MSEFLDRSKPIGAPARGGDTEAVILGGNEMGTLSDGQKRLVHTAMHKRGFSRSEAAAYIGISPTKFDQLVADGRMPKAKQIDGRKVWDIRELDPAFEELGTLDTSWDDP